MKKNNFLHKGFTLVELLLVMALLAVLMGGLMIIINPNAQRARATDARRKSDLNQMQKALETYYQDNGKYPDYDSATGKIKEGATIYNWGGPWGVYMRILPKDPKPVGPFDYVYKTDATRQIYWLFATLERSKEDTQACNYGTANAGKNCANALDICCSGAQCANCTYGVSSPNTTP